MVLTLAYYKGLSEAVKDQIGPNPLEKLKDLVNQSIKTNR